MYLLDTNVVSELHKTIRGEGDAQVAAWLAQVELAACWLSVITLMELEIEVLRMERRDAAQGRVLRTWLESRIVPRFSGRVLDIDAATARRCAVLHVPDRQPERDAMIAATALMHGMTMVTRNVADFEATGVLVFNPWQYRAAHEAERGYAADA